MTSRTGKPIVIADYDPAWPAKFDAERALILDACGESSFAGFEHVGSTSVPGLGAKPVIDMMPGLRSLDDAPPLIPKLEGLGYEYVPEFERRNAIDEGMPFRRHFRKDVAGERAFHVHMVEVGSDFWRDHLMFRDWLRTHPEDAREYEGIKREIAARYNAALSAASEINRDYTEHKSPFIASVMAKARAVAGTRTA